MDINQYRNEHESDEHWKLRKAFLLHFQNDFDEQILLRNAQLFMNIETLGCKYSAEVMTEIANLANQVPAIRKYRNLSVNKLKRTLVGANATVQAKYNKEVPKEEAKKVKLEATEWSDVDKNFWMKDSRVQEQNYQLMRLSEEQRFENLRAMLKDVIVFDDLNGVMDFNRTSANMRKIGDFQVTYDDTIGKFLYLFNGQIIGEGKGDSKKMAKKFADKDLETNLRNYCYTIRAKVSYFSNEEVIQRGNDNANKVPDNYGQLNEGNLGFRMLKMLGWKGEGNSLGSKNEGIIDPINLSIKIGRKGLGNDNQNFDANYFRNLLNNFKQNQFEYDLVFSPEFKKEERALIHQMAMQMHLRTKSYGKNESRHLVISSKVSPQVLRQKLIEGNAFFLEKYELIEPLFNKKQKQKLL